MDDLDKPPENVSSFILVHQKDFERLAAATSKRERQSLRERFLQKWEGHGWELREPVQR